MMKLYTMNKYTQLKSLTRLLINFDVYDIVFTGTQLLITGSKQELKRIKRYAEQIIESEYFDLCTVSYFGKFEWMVWPYEDIDYRIGFA